MLDWLVDLALPVSCASCGAPGAVACPRCAKPLLGAAYAVTPDPTPVGFPPTHTVASYDGTTRTLLIAYKEHALSSLAPALGAALAGAVICAASSEPVLVVPIPSRPSSVRQRGFHHVRLLARESVRLLRRAGTPAHMLDCLWVRGSVADQAGLDSRARAANLHGAFVLRRPLSQAGGVVVVDDVVTTGATLVAAAAAFRAIGMPVRAATIAATHRRVRSGHRER